MPAFPELAADDIEAIRQYLRARAQQLTLANQAANQPKTLVDVNGTAAKTGSAAGGGTFAGNWDIVVESPVGKQPGKGVFKVEGSKISGTQSGAQGSVDVKGTVDGSHATMSGKAYVPFPITLEFDVTVDGDTFSGMMKTGPFGTFPVTAKRL
jgi:quinohemoprotein ethanol dehydrogenase